MNTYTIGQTVEITSVTGSVDTGKVVGFKNHRGNNFKWNKYAVVELQHPSSDGVFITYEYLKIK